MPASSLGRRRPRPVADAPTLDGALLAKAWLVELVAVAPLDQATRLPGPRFAEDAPRLCLAVGAALGGDAAFDDLEPGGALAPLAAGAGSLAAAPAPLDAVTALEALRAVTWRELQASLDRPEPELVAGLADRLAAVIATVTAAVLEAPGPPGPPRPRDRGPLAAVLRAAGEGAEDAQPAPVASAPPAPPPAEEPPLAEDPPAEPPVPDVAAPLRDLEATLRDVAGAADPLARLRELAQAAHAEPDRDPFGAAAARLRDRAGPLVEDGTDFHAARIAPWTAAIGRRVARHRQDGRPFAVLCVELADLDRLASAEQDSEVADALEAAEEAVCTRLRPADVLVRERPGRYWLTAPDTDPAEARALAHRVAAAIAEAPAHRGVPLQAAIGLAGCPDDATDADGLEGRAEEGVFAARAAGLRVASAMDL